MKGAGAVTTPTDEMLRAVVAYKSEAELHRMYPEPTRRRADRALRRLRGACDEVLRAIDNLPDGITFYVARLRREAAEIATEAAWRIRNLEGGHALMRLSAANTGTPKQQRALRGPRARLEARVARLFVANGGKPTTYDFRRYVEPRGGQGKRGGHLAKLLLTIYQLAGIGAPDDLTPVLRRLCSLLKADERRKKHVASARDKARSDPRRAIH